MNLFHIITVSFLKSLLCIMSLFEPLLQFMKIEIYLPNSKCYHFRGIYHHLFPISIFVLHVILYVKFDEMYFLILSIGGIILLFIYYRYSVKLIFVENNLLYQAIFYVKRIQPLDPPARFAISVGFPLSILSILFLLMCFNGMSLGLGILCSFINTYLIMLLYNSIILLAHDYIVYYQSGFTIYIDSLVNRKSKTHNKYSYLNQYKCVTYLGMQLLWIFYYILSAYRIFIKIINYFIKNHMKSKYFSFFVLNSIYLMHGYLFFLSDVVFQSLVDWFS
eukprot:225438_1